MRKAAEPSVVPVPLDAWRQVAAEKVDYGDAPPDANLMLPHGFDLAVRVVGVLGLPVRDARVFVAPDACGFSLWPVKSDAAGVVRLHWRGRQRIMDVQIAVTAWGVMQPIRRVAVEESVVKRVAFVARGRQQDAVAVLDQAELEEHDGRRDVREVARQRRRSSYNNKARERLDKLDIRCGRTMFMYRFDRCHKCHDSSRVAVYRTIARAGVMGAGPHPQASFQDLRVRRPRASELDERRKEVAELLREQQAANRARAAKARARVVGRVVGIDGKPAIGVPVAWFGERGTLMLSTKTDGLGRYRLGPMPRGQHHLLAGGGPLGLADHLLRVAATGETVWNCSLQANRVVAGFVLDEQGEGLRGWRVELVRDAIGWAGTVAANKSGRFTAYGVPGPVECLLWPKGKNSAFPVVYGTEALVDASDVILKLDDQHPVRGRLRARVVLPAGSDQARIDARVIQLETGRVAQMSGFGFEDAFAVEPLAPGKYRVQLGLAGSGWIERDIQVDGRGLWQTGHMHVPSPGHVRLVHLPGAYDVLRKTHGFYRRTRSVDVLQDYVQGERERRLGIVTLPPGKYVLVWRGDEGAKAAVRARELVVASGVETELTIWPEEFREKAR